MSLLVLQFPKFFRKQLSSQGAEMTDEQYAVAVVGLMKKATRRPPVRLSLERSSLAVLRSQDSRRRSVDLSADLADRQTALLSALFAFDGDDFGISRHQLDAITVHHK